MKLRKLGSDEIKITPLIFGGNVFGWTIDERKSFEILDAYLDAGFNCIDTADVYSAWAPGNKGGESEVIIGKWIAARKNRDRVVIATKVGMEVQGEKGLAPAYITRALEASLTRLQTDYIDLYQAHRDDETVPLEETLAAFEKIRASGKARVIGASNYEPARLKKAVDAAKVKGIAGYRTLQPLYNLYDRQTFEEAAEKVCTDNDLSVITYSSLASGFLTGKYHSAADVSKSARGEGIKKKYINGRGTEIIQALDEVSEQVKATPAQVALAWLLHRPSVTAPIVSATSVIQLQEILKAANVSLNAGALDRLNEASEWREDAP